jgi:hypothetical protein
MLVVVSTRSSFDEALAAADAIGTIDIGAAGLASPLHAAIRKPVEEAWDMIRSALIGAIRSGEEHSRTALHSAIAKMEEVAAAAGARAREVEEAVLAKLREFVQVLIDGALRQVRDTLTIGSRMFQVDRIEVRQKLTLGGSIHASITDVWELASTADLEIGASYVAAQGT